MRRNHIYILALAILCSVIGVNAQTISDTSDYGDQKYNTTADPPAIGLALSGGAAHGLAHIGVIKYLEELDIPIDYITGTSMGSIVGGLLAMGYNAEEMTEIAENLDWDEIMSSKTRLDEVAPLEKFYHDKFPVLLTWQDKELILPSGILGGQKLDLTLSRLFFPTLAIDNFDDLVIPYRCMAVDISTGDILTLDSGFLGQAIRASMAIPMVFTPVEIDGRLLVDGGLRRNLPAQENLEMGSDIVIGVYVGSQKESKEELKSSFDILIQSTQMMGFMDSDKQMDLCDILILPDVKDFGTLDFKNYEQLIQAGYDAAKLNTEQFLKLKTKLSSRAESLPIKKIDLPSRMYVNEIATPNLSETLRQIALNRSGLSPRSYIDLEEIDEGVSRMYGTKNFQNLNYIFSQDDNDETNLVINADPAKKTEVGATFNRFASTNSAIILSAIIRNKISEPSRLTLVSRVSDNPGLKADYFRRMGGNGDAYIRIFSTYDQIEKSLRVDNSFARAYTSKNFDFGVSLGYETNNQIKVEVGYRFDQEIVDALQTRDEFEINYTQPQNVVFVSSSYNTLDRTTYPTSGIKASLNLSYNYGRDTEQYIIKEDGAVGTVFTSILKSQAINSKLNSISSAYGFLRIGDSLFDNLLVGGVEQVRLNNAPFIGLAEGALNFKSALLLRQEFRISPLNKVYFSAILNLIIGEEGFGSSMPDETSTFVGVGLKLGVDSPVGPIDFVTGVNTSGHSTAALGVGYRFIF